MDRGRDSVRLASCITVHQYGICSQRSKGWPSVFAHSFIFHTYTHTTTTTTVLVSCFIASSFFHTQLPRAMHV